MFQVGQRVAIKLPRGKVEQVAITAVGLTLLTVQFSDGGQEVIEVSHFIMLRNAAG